MLIDQSYFIGPLTIAQLGQPAVVDDLNNYIAVWEPAIMEAALGYDFYQVFLQGLEVGSGEEPDKRWLDLLNGVLFTNFSQVKKRWVGFAGVPSPLAGFIYYEYLKGHAKQVTGIGVVKSEGENSTPASPAMQMCDAFNYACRQMFILEEFLQTDFFSKTRIYPEYDYGKVNYYGYNSDAYSFRPINVFGI